MGPVRELVRGRSPGTPGTPAGVSGASTRTDAARHTHIRFRSGGSNPQEVRFVALDQLSERADRDDHNTNTHTHHTKFTITHRNIFIFIYFYYLITRFSQTTFVLYEFI